MMSYYSSYFSGLDPFGIKFRALKATVVEATDDFIDTRTVGPSAVGSTNFEHQIS